MAQISVIIPAYNQEHFISQAIYSVLSQTFADFELIVVDDGSTDRTSDILARVEDPRMCVLRQANAGLSAARNAGIRSTSAPLVTFLDADDMFLPHKLAILNTYLREHEQIGLVAGGIYVVDEQGAILSERVQRPASLKLPELVFGNTLPVSGILLRRDWLSRVGDFDETLRACEDWDMWLRLAAAGCDFAWVERAVVAYRIHGGQMTQDAERMRTAMLNVLSKFFSRVDIPSDLLAYRGKAWAAALVKSAARAYRAGLFQIGGKDLLDAIHLDRDLCKPNYSPLVALLRGWADDPQTPDAEEFLKQIYSHLPAGLEGLRGQLRRAMAAVIIGHLFRAPRRVRRSCRNSVLRAIRYDPTWLFNRGVLRIVADAWLSLLMEPA